MSKIASIRSKRAGKASQPTGRFLALADLNDPDVDNLLRVMAYIQREIDRREAEKPRKAG